MRFEQFGVELGLDGSERNVQLIARLVHVVEVGAAVEEVGAPCLVAQAGADQSVGGGHQGSGAVDHRRVHHLSLPGAPRFDEGGDHPKGEVEGAPAEISHQIERRGRGLAGAADRGERAGERDVVEVVPGGVRERAALSPAGDPPVHQSRVSGPAGLRSDSEALGHTRAKALDEDLRCLAE